MRYVKMVYDIKDLLISISDFCLGSCVYCNLWKLEGFNPDQEFLVDDVTKMLSDPYMDGLENIHLTGGEPILSPKLLAITKAIKRTHPDVRLNMPVSGFFPYLTYRYVKRIHSILPKIRIDVSVDATTAKIHEQTRSGKGSWKFDVWDPLNKTIELLRTIKELGVQLQFTLMETNYNEIVKVQQWAETLGFGFYLCFPRFGKRFGHPVDKSHKHNQEFIDAVDEEIKDGWCKIRPLNQQIWMCQKAIWEGKTVYHDCYMGQKSIDVTSKGEVFPCMCYYSNQLMGNIRMNSLTEILESDKAKEVLEGIKKRECQPCIMPVCPWKKNFVIDGKRVDF